jgi:hypothetical protein
MTFQAETGRKSGLSAAGALFAIWTLAWMIEGASLVPATRGPLGPLVGAAMGFAVAMFPALLFSLARTGRGALAARIVVLGTAGAVLAAAVWLAFPETRYAWEPLW